MAMTDKESKIESSIYKYTATMKYVLGSTIIDIDALQIKSIAIDYNYRQNNIPMIFITAAIHDDYADLMIENQDAGYFIFNMSRCIANSDMPDLYTTYIEDKFVYFITPYDDAGLADNGINQNADLIESENKDLYHTLSIGLLSMEHLNKNKKAFNAVLHGNLSSIMYYITGHLKILMEPPTDNIDIENLILPPLNSVAKALEYLNSITVLYDTPYRYFIDFDCAYLLSSSGNAVKKKGEDITTIYINVMDENDIDGKVEGMSTDEKKKMYILYVDEDCFEVVDDHASAKSYSKVLATGTSGTPQTQEIKIPKEFNVLSKTRNIRVLNDNFGMLNNMISALNNTAVQVMIQKSDLDSSVFTLNKEYILQADDIYDGEVKDRYDGKYLLTRKRELYIRIDNDFTTNVMLMLDKLPEDKNNL